MEHYEFTPNDADVRVEKTERPISTPKKATFNIAKVLSFNVFLQQSPLDLRKSDEMGTAMTDSGNSSES